MLIGLSTISTKSVGNQIRMRDCAEGIIPSAEQQCTERQFVRAQLSHSVSEPICSVALQHSPGRQGAAKCECLCDVSKGSVCYVEPGRCTLADCCKEEGTEGSEGKAPERKAWVLTAAKMKAF